ncbi:hypothetical protein ACIPVB_08815 [Microbacterium sp. NPDC090007]|uniref:hypothetical protein n=1 Tax=Microbacterium sp. NPDC090007 TaxID=3364204 RepID=UPI0038268286
MRERTITATLGAVGLAVALLSAPTAANAAVRLDPPSDTTSAALLADCSSVTPNGRAYARLNVIALCGADTIPADRPLRTENVGGEECGTVTLTLAARGGGLASIAWRTASDTGPIVGVALDISYVGRLGGAVQRYVQDRASLHATGRTVAYTGSGPVTATVSGTIETFTATCRVAPASVRIQAR